MFREFEGVLLVLPNVDNAAELRFVAQEFVQQISGRCLVALRICHCSGVQSCFVSDIEPIGISRGNTKLNIFNSPTYQHFDSIKNKFYPRKFLSSKRG